MKVVTDGILMICGACIALGIIHFRFWLMERTRHDQLAFSVGCLSMAAYAGCEILMMNASTPADFHLFARWSFIPGSFLLFSTAWFAYINLQGRRWLFLTFCSVRLLALVVHLVIPGGINFREVKAIGHVTLFGETVGYPIAVPNPWMLIAQIAHLLLIIFCIDSSVLAWRRGERRKALVFGTGVLLFGGTILTVSIGVLWGFFVLPVIVSFSIFFVVAAMVYELNYDMQRSSLLSKKLIEREAALNETLDFLNLSANAANVGMWSNKIGEDKIWLSEKACKIWEFPIGQHFTAEDFFQRIHPEDRQLVLAGVEDLEGEKGAFVVEYRMMTKSGNLRWVESRGKVETIDGIKIARGAVVDITKRKLAEESARRTEEQNTAIVNAIPDFIFLIDSDGVYLDFHAKDLDDLLLPPDRFIGKNMRDVLPASLADEFFHSFERALLSPEPQIVEYKLEQHDEEKWYEARIVRMGNNYLSVVRDITRIKLAYEAVSDLSRRLMNAQEKERARIARELHDDLSQSLALFSIQLSQLSYNPTDAIDSRNQIDYLVSELSRVGAHVHRLSHELHPAKLTQLGLETALRGLCREIAAAHHLRIDFEAEKLPVKLPDDISLCLYRVAQEALQNVVKHSCATSVRASIGMQNGEVRMTITDDGIGFETNGAKVKESLGLISINERVRAVKGMIRIESELGAGTKIEAIIPVQQQV